MVRVSSVAGPNAESVTQHSPALAEFRPTPGTRSIEPAMLKALGRTSPQNPATNSMRPDRCLKVLQNTYSVPGLFVPCPWGWPT